MSAPDPSPAATAQTRSVPWDVIFQGLGIGAAVVGWVAVVGGGMVWARLESARIPATQTLSGLPRDLYVVEGLQTLLLPLVLATAVAVFAYYATRNADDERAEQQRLDEEVQRRQTEADEANDRLARSKATGSRAKRAPTDAKRRSEVLRSRRYGASAADARLSAAIAEAGRGRPKILSRSFSGMQERYGARRAAVLGGLVVLIVLAVGIARTELSWETLGGALAIGVVVSGAVVVAVRTVRPRPDVQPSWRVALVSGIVALIVFVPVAVLLAVSKAMELWPQFALMVAVTVAGAWITLRALVGRSPRGAALTLFGAFALWSGTLAYLQEWGDKTPKLEQVRVDLTTGDSVYGYMLGRSTDRLYVAQDTGPKKVNEKVKVKDWRRHVVILNGDDVEQVLFGRELPLPEDQVVRAAEDEARRSGGDDAAVERAAEDARNDELETRQQAPGPDATPSGGGGNGSTGTDDEPLPRTPSDHRRDLDVNGVPGQFQVLALVRSENTVELDARLVNMSDKVGEPRRMRIGGAFDDGKPDTDGATDTLDGLQFLDRDNRNVHLVDRDDEDDECACSTGLRRITVEPGRDTMLWASFIAPPEDVVEVDLIVPGIGFIRHVQIEIE